MNPSEFEDLKNKDTEAITSNKDLGRLNFESIQPILKKFREILLEIYDLN